MFYLSDELQLLTPDLLDFAARLYVHHVCNNFVLTQCTEINQRLLYQIKVLFT